MLLAQMYLQSVNSTATPLSVERITCIADSSCPFTPSIPSRQINYLWFSSLILSLVTASFGMLVKQWLREYLSGNFALGRSHLRLRFFRYIGMVKWRVFQIASLLPLLLQLALALFFAGLCIFSTHIDPRLGSLTSSLVATWAVLLLLILAAPAFSPRCPYKVTFLKEFMHRVRLFLSKYLHVDYDMSGRRSPLSEELFQERQISTSPMEEESFAVNKASLSEDLDILFALDCELVDDGLLETGIAGLLIPLTSQPGTDITQVQNPPEGEFVLWAMKIIQNRVQNKQATRLDVNVRMVFNGQLSIKAWSAIVDLLSHTITSSLRISDASTLPEEWMADAVTILLSHSGYSLPVNGQKALSECLRINPSFFAKIFCARTFAPRFAFQYSSSSTFVEPTGRDAFAILLNAGVGDILRHLHGDDLLTTLYHLLYNRYGLLTDRKGNTHNGLLDFLKTRVFIRIFPRVRLDGNGGLGRIIDMMYDELDFASHSELSISMPHWAKKALSVIFISNKYWSEDHYRRTIGWLSQKDSLLWYLQLAKPALGSHNELEFQDVGRSMTIVAMELFMGNKPGMPASGMLLFSIICVLEVNINRSQWLKLTGRGCFDIFQAF